MIVRQLCLRQSRQLLALNRQLRIPTRSSSSSTETPVRPPIQITETSRNRPEGESSMPELSESQIQSSREAWRHFQARTKQFETLGSSSVEDSPNPDDVFTNPPRAADITLEMLLAAQTHFGHSVSRWNPQNSRYIFGVRDHIHIIALDQTAAYLRRAAKVVEEIAARGALILFAGTRPGQKEIVVKAAEMAKGYHVFERWIPGTITNRNKILANCRKQVVNAKDEELPEFAGTLVDRAALRPDLVVCLNPVENYNLLNECGLHNIPTIGIVDTDANPTRVTYQIPANDDSLRSVALIAGVLGRAAEEGQRRRLAMAERNEVPYETVKAEELFTDPLTGVMDSK